MFCSIVSPSTLAVGASIAIFDLTAMIASQGARALIYNTCKSKA